VAPPPGTLRVGRYLLALVALLVVLYALVFFGDRHTPKLGLDLVGGTQVIFQAKTPNGGTPSSSSMEQAQHIIQERVNGTGVTEATVVIQGSDQLVVSIPGGTKTDVAKLGAAAVLNLRGLVAPAVGVNCGKNAVTPSASPTSSGSSASPASAGSSSSAPASTPKSSSGASAQDAGHRPLAAAPTSTGATPSTSPKTSATSAAASGSGSAATSGASSAASSAAATPPKCVADPLGALKKSDPSLKIPLTDKEFEALPAAKQQEIAAALSTFDCNAGSDEKDDPKSPFVACDSTGQIVYLLGPVIVPGKQIDSASAQAPNVANGQTEWAVGLNFKSNGQASWAKYTAAHNIGDSSGSTNASSTNCNSSTYPCADFVGFTLDGRVISLPVNETAINGGTTQIRGSFTETSANQLADQLRFGALPLSFTAQQAQTVSATLGTSQLKAGLLAGGIGLILVVLYSLFYYRALGLVTIASLLVSGALTYAMLVVLGTQIGFTLSLAGIAGFIVAVGITADSFVVFFERIKDEVHGGRSVRVAVPRAWVRARRTILSADTVSFLAAAILYYFAAGDVKGFAFTLGLSTIIDLVVVFLFTHPVVSLLSRSRAFGSARFTGLDSVRTGPVLADPPSADRAKARRRTGGSKPAVELEKKSAVAVLDEEEADSPEAQATDLEPEATAESGRDADETPRRRTAPEPGSAAERAAARRARLRAKQDKEGER
jgi:preprotein translocase subunit SecD